MCSRGSPITMSVLRPVRRIAEAVGVENLDGALILGGFGQAEPDWRARTRA
jgi:hypothetical protein